MTQEQSVTRCPTYHGKHGEPHIGETLRWKSTIPDAEHMGHGFKERPRILFEPERSLETHTQRQNVVIPLIRQRAILQTNLN